jgi:F-type H+-transporting ATPase subunit b
VDITKFIFEHYASFVWSLVAFGLFVVIIYRFGVKAIVTALDAREARIKAQIDEAEAINAKAKHLQADLEKRMREVEDQVSVTMNRVRVEAEHAKEALLEKGRGEVEALRLRAVQDIEAARHTAIVGLRQEIADIATEVAGKIIKVKLDDARQGELVGKAIEAYESAGKR